MSTDDQQLAPPSDFLAQMYLLLAEESRLFEFPVGSIELDGDRAPVTHGPWDPADCSRQLLAWFDAGLIELFAHPPDDVARPRNADEWRAWNAGEHLRSLDADDARQLLERPERWSVDSDDGLVAVVRTDAGIDPDARFW